MRRITYGHDVADVLDANGGLFLLFFVATGFAAYANDTIRTVLEERGLSAVVVEDPIEVLPLKWHIPNGGPYSFDRRRDLEAVRWRIDSILGWQQIDRRIDE